MESHGYLLGQEHGSTGGPRNKSECADTCGGSNLLDDVQADLEILTYQGDYLSVLFGYLEKAENFAIYLIGCFPNPTLLRYAERFSINLLNGNRHSLYIKRFSKWLPKGTLLHMDTEIQQPPDTLKRSGEDTYEVIREGFVEIPEQKDYFLLTEELL